MAILLVRIENTDSLALNEFFDYNGFCYASTRSRQRPDDKIIDLEEFYEADIATKLIRDIPVVFVGTDGEKADILGWYKKAEVHAQMLIPSFFLEGNIKAYVSDAVWLPEDFPETQTRWLDKDEKMYEVVEPEDSRYDYLSKVIEYSTGSRMIRYGSASLVLKKELTRNYETCISCCEQLASKIVDGEFQDILDLKRLEGFARKACSLRRDDPDGYYYLALALYQLGFVKEGLKNINRAMKLDPDASDVYALKGMLLFSRGHREDAARTLHMAYDLSGDDDYLILEGKTHMLEGKIDKAYDCFKMVNDTDLLEESGIRLGDMEKKWSFIKLRGLKIKDIFHKIGR